MTATLGDKHISGSTAYTDRPDNDSTELSEEAQQNPTAEFSYQDKRRSRGIVSKYPRKIKWSTSFLEYDKGIVFKPVSIWLMYHQDGSRGFRLNGPHPEDTAHPSSYPNISSIIEPTKDYSVKIMHDVIIVCLKN